jgi:PAS domain S-box-containing protein
VLAICLLSVAAAVIGAVAAARQTSRLRAAEGERDRFFAMSWDLLGVVGRDGRLPPLNAMWEKSLGLPLDSLTSRPLLDFIHPADRAAMETELGRLRAAPGEAAFQNRFECPDGTHKWLSWTARSSLPAGAVDVVVRDLGARLRPQPSVEETRNFLDSIIENIPNMVFVKDAKDLNFVMFNRAGEELLGQSRENFIGKNDYDFFPKEEADFFTGKDREVLASGRVVDIPEEPIQTAKGKRLLHTKKIGIRDGKGTIAYLLGISEDVTELKNAEKMRAEIVAMTTHELRTPLTSIVWGLDMLAHGDTGTLPERAQEVAELSLRSAQLMVRMINDYLDIVKIESGAMPFVLRPVSLGHFLEESLRVVTPFAERFGVRFALRQEAPGARVSADADRLMQVLSNLLTNAAKFSPQGSEIQVLLERRASDGVVRVSISDRGPGVPEAAREEIFQKFMEARAADPRRKGTGLGLSISKTIVEKLGGRIDFESDGKSGATFFFELPELPPLAPPPPAAPKAR